MYEPAWDGPIHGYVINDLRRQHWRIARTVPWPDAEQEAYCVFLRCRRAYLGKVERPEHFMALFKTAWHRRMADLSNEATLVRENELHELAPISSASVAREHVGETENAGILATMVRQAPSEVRMVLALLLDAPEELLEAALAGFACNRDGRARAKGSARVNALLGLPADRDTLGELRDYFSS